MARRQKGPINLLLDATARLGWVAGSLLAVATHLGFRWIAAQKPAGNVNLTEASDQVLWVAAGTLSVAFQWLVPALVMFGVMAGALRRRRQGALVDQVSLNPQQRLASLSWREFEELMSGYFRREGYSVESNPDTGPDGGVDIELRRNGELYLVQCKHWRARKVPVATVRELFGVMTARGAVAGFVVSSGQFTQDAMDFASGRNIEIVGGAALLDRLGHQTGMSVDSLSCDTSGHPPNCPKCGAGMVRRVAKRGKNAGNAFWGCSAYPRCRGTRIIT